MKHSVFIAILLCMTCVPCFASPFAKVIRRASKVGDNVPIRQMEHLAKSPATSRSARNLIENEMQAAGRHLDDAMYNRELTKTLEKTLTGVVDPSTMKIIKQMDTPTQETILLLSRGSKNVEKMIPDIAMRSRFMKNASGETLIALGRGDDKFLKEIIDLDTKIGAKTLKSPAGMKALSLDDVGMFFQKTGEAGMNFWKKSVRPHWQLWLGGAALTAILLAPEEYLDAVGNLTKEGLKKVAQFGGDVLAKALSGTIEGVTEAGKKVIKDGTETAVKSFFSDVWGVILFIGTCITTIIVLWILPVTRPIMRWIFGLFSRKRNAKSEI